MNRILFEYPAGAPTDTLEFTWGLELNPPTFNLKVPVPTSTSLDGTLYAYNKGISSEIIILKVDVITEAEKTALINWIENIVEGGAKIFRYTNQDGVAKDVFFAIDKYKFKEGTIPFSIDLSLQVEQ